jgi:hypothetical protein
MAAFLSPVPVRDNRAFPVQRTPARWTSITNHSQTSEIGVNRGRESSHEPNKRY